VEFFIGGLHIKFREYRVASGAERLKEKIRADVIISPVSEG
jgi:hypothetical protein